MEMEEIDAVSPNIWVVQFDPASTIVAVPLLTAPVALETAPPFSIRSVPIPWSMPTPRPPSTDQREPASVTVALEPGPIPAPLLDWPKKGRPPASITCAPLEMVSAPEPLYPIIKSSSMVQLVPGSRTVTVPEVPASYPTTAASGGPAMMLGRRAVDGGRTLDVTVEPAEISSVPLSI